MSGLIDMGVMTRRAFQFAETLVKATAQDNSLTRESHTVGVLVKFGEILEAAG